MKKRPKCVDVVKRLKLEAYVVTRCFVELEV